MKRSTLHPMDPNDENLKKHTDLACLYDASKGLYLLGVMVSSLAAHQMSSDIDETLTLNMEETGTLQLIASAVLAAGIRVEEILHQRGLCLLEDPDIGDVPIVGKFSIHKHD